ncbi:hypothetical protein HDE_06868 [Halotydeus destructor]|nr:hypothetical protein HDE_06868 [Halotydeus destructor]
MSSNSNNFNRQFSSPVQDGQSRRRQSSLTIPPRPATASPTTPSRPFCPLPSTHEERSNSGYVQGPNVPARRSSHSVTRHRPPYIEALLDNQTRQYDRLVQESRKLNSNLSTMAFTVSHLEDEVFSQPARRANYDKYLEMLELRKEIRQLKIDCHSLITEVDLFGEYPFSGAGSTMNRNLPNRVSGPNEPEGPPPLPPRPRHPRQPELDFGKLFQRVPPPKPDSHTMKHRPSFPSKTPSPKMHLNQDSYVLRSQRVHRLSEQAGNGSSSSVNYEYNGNEVYGDMTNSRTGSDNWTCLGCTFKNHHELTSCEMCELRKGSYASMEGFR